MPIATTPAKVADYLGRSSVDTDRTNQLITWAEAQMAAMFPGMYFGDPVTGATTTIYGNGDDRIWTANYPVTAVTAVTIDGTALTANEYRHNTLGEIRRTSFGIIAGGSLHSWDDAALRWPDGGTVIVATYNYGWASTDVPPEVELVATDLVAGRIRNPEGVSQESIGDRTVSFVGGGTAGMLTVHHKRILRSWQRHRYDTMRMRTGP